MYRIASCVVLMMLTLHVTPVVAQVSVPGYHVVVQRQERLSENHWLLTGAVELEQGDTKLYADEVEVFEGENKVIARGNVVLTQGNNRIAADSAEFNLETHLGTFHRASGIATVQPPRQTAQPGIVVPTQTGQDTDVIFFGETVEKIAARKYKITNGGFSTCVQPTPRWDLSADTLILYLDHYTLLRQAILKVKGVPMFYLPVMYYPTKEDGRATGFLIPTYGMSTIRGQTIHNAFFWAINRSHDATLMYDWYSKTGGGGGFEYRYNVGAGSDGAMTAYVLDQRAATYQLANGSASTQPASRSYTVNGIANQLLPGRLRARGSANYFSSILTNQTFSTNVNDANRNNRNFGANVVGSWGSYTLNGTFDRTEWFSTVSNSSVTGSSPRVSFSRSERPIAANAPIYFGMASEVAHLDRLTRSADVTVDDRSIGRFDLYPQLRYPFKRWQWFTVNSSLSWRETFYSRSLDAATRLPIEENLNRQYFTASAQMVGPVFTRVWDTPANGYAERFKHSIEPFFNAQRTSQIEQSDQIIVVDGIDSVFGGTTSLTYGINNRIYAKRRGGQGQRSQATEIISVDINQTHYSDARASQVDSRYATSYTGGQPNNFSPISIGARIMPVPNINANLRAEVDSRYRQLRTLSLNANYGLGGYLQTAVGWSHKFLIKDLQGFNDPNALDHYVNFSANAHTLDNKYGTNYSFNYDVLRSRLLQQRASAFYNAQCCGIAFEYQRYNFGGLAFVVPSDQRFFLSFTLAGLGNFSPFNGGLSGVPR